MSYTNYWTPKSCFTEEQRQKMVDFTEKAIKLSGVKICNWDGTGKPEVTAERIGFNGDEAEGLDHESFVLLADSEWNFCKTARKPYDVVVKACLIYAEKIGILKDWSFDGEETESEYLDGMKLYKAAMLAPSKDERELTQEDYDEMRDSLIEMEVELLSDQDIHHILMNGCRGYANMEDDEVFTQFVDAFGEDRLDELGRIGHTFIRDC